MRTTAGALTIVVGAASWFAPASALAGGCKRGSEGFERSQFGVDLGLSLGGGATAAVGRFSILDLGGSGLAYGLTTGVTRVVAARHHWSDILVGGFIGTGIGLLPIATETIGRHGEGEIAIGPWLGGAGGQVGGRF